MFQLAANDGLDDVPSRTGRYVVIGCKLKQNANEGCNGCVSLAELVSCFIACFVLLVIAPLDENAPDEQRLLSSLLARYEPASRPTHNASDVVSVRFGLTLAQISDMV